MPISRDENGNLVLIIPIDDVLQGTPALRLSYGSLSRPTRREKRMFELSRSPHKRAARCSPRLTHRRI